MIVKFKFFKTVEDAGQKPYTTLVNEAVHHCRSYNLFPTDNEVYFIVNCETALEQTITVKCNDPKLHTEIYVMNDNGDTIDKYIY